MGKERDNNKAFAFASGQSWLGRWITPTFWMVLCCLSVAIVFLLLRRGMGEVLLIALAAGALVGASAWLEITYFGGTSRIWNAMPALPALLVMLFLLTLALCYPTLNGYFMGDDFAYVRLFHAASFTQNLALFCTDLSQGLWGMTIQELRPLYGMSYKLLYSVWGLQPSGYHFIAILLHVLNSFMVLLITMSIFPGLSWRAAFAGVLFAVLPMHSESINWISGALSDGPPTFLYLGAFLCFIWFRRRGQNRYLILSTLAFAGCLMSKEIAVTLPVMLISYDLFRDVLESPAGSTSDGAPQQTERQSISRVYAPFAGLLLAYLGLRWYAFGSILHEDQWSSSVGEILSGHAGFLDPLAHLATRFARIVALDIRQFLLPFPSLLQGCVLGLYLAWTISLLLRQSVSRASMSAIVYFGVVWSLISSAPLLLAPFGPGPRHLYLAAAGQCIAIAVLVLPVWETATREARRLRLLGAIFVVSVSASQLRTENAQWVHWGEKSMSETTQLATALETIPEQSLIVVKLTGWTSIFPYALQEPFSRTDLYSTRRVIEFPENYCCPILQWWQKNKLALVEELAGNPDQQIKISLLDWGEENSSFIRTERVLSREQLRAFLTQSLGSPLESVNSIGEDQAKHLVEALARMVSEGID